MWERFSALSPVAWVLGNWQLVLALAGALVLSHGVAFCQGVDHGKATERASAQEAAAKARAIEVESAGVAAEEREADTNEIESDEENASAAIENATNAEGDTRPSGASNALNCERLRRRGVDLDRVPACRGRTP